MHQDNFKICVAYVSDVNAAGTQIWVSEWGSPSQRIPVTCLCPIPTDILEGRRLSGVPRHKTGYQEGDLCMCAVIDDHWYLLGYFNAPIEGTGGTTIFDENKKTESMPPLVGGTIHKISDIGQIVYRRTNQIIRYLGEWAKTDIQGETNSDIKDATYNTKFFNFVREWWGGFTEWKRLKDDNTEVLWSTSKIDVIGKKHESLEVSDARLPQKVKNIGIDDSEPKVSVDDPERANPDNLRYTDKIIKRSGTIDDDSHVYEREVRQSLEGDKEKTGFTRLREGDREGVLREFETENILKFTHTTEKTGANINDNNRLAAKQYTLSDADSVQQAQLTEEFGPGVDDLYVHNIVDAVGNYVKTQKTDDGLVVTVADSTDAKIVTILIDHEGNVNVNASTKIVVEAPNIEIGEGATEHLILGDKLASWISTTLKVAFDTHIHGTGVGPSTPPTVPLTDASGILSPDHTTK